VRVHSWEVTQQIQLTGEQMICPEVSALLRLRQKYHLSRDFVASITKIPSQNIYRYEKGKATPIRVFRQKIADFVRIIQELEKEGTNE
jgi:transcriptional regulator with XRE-family HTH domain